MKKYLWVLLIGATLFRAAQAQSPLAPAKLAVAELADPQKGVALYSLGALSSCTAAVTGVRFVDRSAGKLAFDGPSLFIDNRWEKSDFSDHHGTVGALALPAGKYYLTPWIVNPFVVAKNRLEFSFDIVAGETTYIGELFMPKSCATSTSFVVRDQYERDMALILQMNAHLSERVAVKRLMRNAAAGEPAPAAVVERWDASMSCTARIDGVKSEPYKVEFAAERRGSDFSLSRETGYVAEKLAGRIRDGSLELIGTGARLQQAGVKWQFAFRGKFTEGAGPVDVAGNMVLGREVLRNCALRLARR